MTDSDIDLPRNAPLLGCLAAMHLGLAQAQNAIEFLRGKGFGSGAAQERVLRIALSLWSPPQSSAH
jgi:hypothetical protein